MLLNKPCEYSSARQDLPIGFFGILAPGLGQHSRDFGSGPLRAELKVSTKVQKVLSTVVQTSVGTQINRLITPNFATKSL